MTSSYVKPTPGEKSKHLRFRVFSDLHQFTTLSMGTLSLLLTCVNCWKGYLVVNTKDGSIVCELGDSSGDYHAVACIKGIVRATFNTTMVASWVLPQNFKTSKSVIVQRTYDIDKDIVKKTNDFQDVR